MYTSVSETYVHSVCTWCKHWYVYTHERFALSHFCYYMCVCFINTLHLCPIKTSLSLYTQAQYEFIHNALSELVVCGETEVTASNLKTYTDKLNDHMEESELTGSQKHFQVKWISVLSF